MDERVAVIGAGAMGGAILQGMLARGFPPADLQVIEIDEQRRKFFQDRGVRADREVGPELGGSAVVIIAVKPGQVCSLLKRLSGHLSEKNLVLSVAAGVTMGFMETCLDKPLPLARTMPNIAARVGQAAVGMSFNPRVSPAQVDIARRVMESVGLVFPVEERLLDTVTGLSGSGPAYVFMLVEALADAGVLHGLPRDRALGLAVQTVYGAAELLRSGEEHPALAREAVTSPGGTTARGLQQLEERGFRNALIRAVGAAVERAREISASMERGDREDEQGGR
ncbi:MAG: pyrroline-5-carboxylate reductase [Spirochaetota bacterium]